MMLCTTTATASIAKMTRAVGGARHRHRPTRPASAATSSTGTLTGCHLDLDLWRTARSSSSSWSSLGTNPAGRAGGGEGDGNGEVRGRGASVAPLRLSRAETMGRRQGSCQCRCRNLSTRTTTGGVGGVGSGRRRGSDVHVGATSRRQTGDADGDGGKGNENGNGKDDRGNKRGGRRREESERRERRGAGPPSGSSTPSLVTLDSSPFLDPLSYCRRSSFPGGSAASPGGASGSNDGTLAARRLQRGKEMTMNIVRYQLCHYGPAISVPEGPHVEPGIIGRGDGDTTPASVHESSVSRDGEDVSEFGGKGAGKRRRRRRRPSSKHNRHRQVWSDGPVRTAPPRAWSRHFPPRRGGDDGGGFDEEEGLMEVSRPKFRDRRGRVDGSGPSEGRAFVLRGHGVPVQLLRDHLDLCDEVLRTAGDDVDEVCFYGGQNTGGGISGEGGGSGGYGDDDDGEEDSTSPTTGNGAEDEVKWMHVRLSSKRRLRDDGDNVSSRGGGRGGRGGTTRNAVLPWPSSSFDGEAQVRLRLYLTVMRRLSSVFGWMIDPENRQPDMRSSWEYPYRPPDYWTVRLLRGGGDGEGAGGGRGGGGLGADDATEGCEEEGVDYSISPAVAAIVPAEPTDPGGTATPAEGATTTMAERGGGVDRAGGGDPTLIVDLTVRRGGNTATTIGSSSRSTVPISSSSSPSSQPSLTRDVRIRLHGWSAGTEGRVGGDGDSGTGGGGTRRGEVSMVFDSCFVGPS